MAIKFNRSQTFAINGTVTAAGLHNLVDGMDIYQALITDQTNLASVGTGDKLLIADSDLAAGDAPRSTTVANLFDDALTAGTYTNAQITGEFSAGTGTFNRTVATSATITTGTIPNATLGTTTATAATITTGTIPTGTFGTTTSTAATITTGTIPTLTIGTTTATRGTITTLNSTTGTIGNLSTTLAGDFTISQGTGTLVASGVTVGTYGTSGIVPTISVDSKGRITAVSTSAVTVADASITPAKLSQPLTLGTSVASTSGTAIDFTGIPSWVKKITVMFDGVSTSAVTGYPSIQLGTSSGVTTSGYTSNVGTTIGTSAQSVITLSSQFGVSNLSAASDSFSGCASIFNITGNNWAYSSITAVSATIPRVIYCSGRVGLASSLDRLRIMESAGASFDAGSVNIMYEG